MLVHQLILQLRTRYVLHLTQHKVRLCLKHTDTLYRTQRIMQPLCLLQITLQVGNHGIVATYQELTSLYRQRTHGPRMTQSLQQS